MEQEYIRYSTWYYLKQFIEGKKKKKTTNYNFFKKIKKDPKTCFSVLIFSFQSGCGGGGYSNLFSHANRYLFNSQITLYINRHPRGPVLYLNFSFNRIYSILVLSNILRHLLKSERIILFMLFFSFIYLFNFNFSSLAMRVN